MDAAESTRFRMAACVPPAPGKPRCARGTAPGSRMPGSSISPTSCRLHSHSRVNLTIGKPPSLQYLLTHVDERNYVRNAIRFQSWELLHVRMPGFSTRTEARCSCSDVFSLRMSDECNGCMRLPFPWVVHRACVSGIVCLRASIVRAPSQADTELRLPLHTAEAEAVITIPEMQAQEKARQTRPAVHVPTPAEGAAA